MPDHQSDQHVNGQIARPTRLGVFWGGEFARACDVCSLRGTHLAPLASSGTITNLRKGFRGRPVEAATAYGFINFFQSDKTLLDKLVANRINPDRIIVPGDHRLNEKGILLLNMNVDYLLKSINNSIFNRYVAYQLADGAFMADIHIRHVAKILIHMRNSIAAGQFSDITEPEHLYERVEEHALCYPQAYSSAGPKRG